MSGCVQGAGRGFEEEEKVSEWLLVLVRFFLYFQSMLIQDKRDNPFSY